MSNRSPRPPQVGDQILISRGQFENRRVMGAVIVGHGAYGEIGAAWIERGALYCDWFEQEDFVPAPTVTQIPMEDCPHDLNDGMRWCDPGDMPPLPTFSPDWTPTPWRDERSAESFPRELRVINTHRGWATCLIHRVESISTHDYRAERACVVAWSKRQPKLEDAIALVRRLFG